jgi:hypothetical protein
MFTCRRADSTTELTPLGAVGRGVAASAVGTLAMDLLLYRRFRGGGGETTFQAWEFSDGLESWNDAPAPAQVGKRLAEGLLGRELPPQRARLVNNVTHWGYGLLAGAQYGLVVGSLRSPKLWHGLTFGSAVWVAGYAVLPAMGIYRPIWKYDLGTLGKDLSAHLVFGASTGAAFRVLAAGRVR